MVSRLDVFLAVGLYPGLSCAELVKKMGKKQVTYASVYNLLQKLAEENLVKAGGDKFFPSDSASAKALSALVYFCFKNSIGYNRLVSEKTAEFVKIGLEKGAITGLPFRPKTVSGIISVLSRHGFAVVESRKPFECRIVYSRFLEMLVENFFGKIKIACPVIVDCIDEQSVNSRLEKEFSAFKKLEKETASFDEIGFIHSSLSLEGNTLTLSETERLIKQNISPASKPFKDAQEILDYKKALDGFLYSDSQILEENILEFHSIAMNSLKSGAGKFRVQNVKIKGNPNFKTPEWKELPSLLKSFFESLRNPVLKKASASKIVEDAAFFHNEFQRIHPFIDGNSRASRAIFMKILIPHGFPLIKIPVGFFDQYMNLTKLSQKRDDKKFALLMKLIVLENLKMIVKKLEYE
jgi:prophage maintenance system killer protein